MGSSSIFILPDNFLRFHQFADRSYFRVDRNDEMELFHREQDNDTLWGGADQLTIIIQNWSVIDCQSAKAQHEAAHVDNGVQVVLNRKRSFMMDDNTNSTTEAFHAIKKRRSGKYIKIAALEHGTEKFAKIVKCFRSSRSFGGKVIKNGLLAIPRSNHYTKQLSGRRADLLVMTLAWVIGMTIVTKLKN